MRRPLIALALAGAVALLGLGCDAGGGGIERHGSAGPDKRGSNGEYEGDPGIPDGGGASDDDGSAPADDDAGEPTPPDAALPPDVHVRDVPLSMLPAEVAKVACQRRLDCCTNRSGLPDDLAGCAQALGELLQPLADEIGRSVGGDRVTYDGVALGHCLEQLAAADCAQARVFEPLLVFESCPFLGATLSNGLACRSSYECDKGYCAGGSASRDGRCTAARLPDGQPCDRADDCASGTCHPALDTCAPSMPGNLCD
jgi:hypothetical protein